MQKISVSASKNYTITISSGKDEFLSAIDGLIKGKKVCIITDETVNGLYKNYFDTLLKKYEVHKAVIPSGEKEKNGQNYLSLINFLAERGFTRMDTIITFGGGVVGDLGAFVASTYMRGIGLIAVPTTVLSMVDSSVGGKTAIDIPAGKNLCGTFYQPDAVYIDTDFLQTLPQKEIMNGYGEIIKYAFLSDTVELTDLNPPVSEKLIAKCLIIKRDIVEKDEKEGGLRKLLNLGHTVGHAIEKLAGFSLSHGECVAKGMSVAIKISARLYGLSEEKVNKMNAVLSSHGHDLSIPYCVEELIKVMKSDKKSGATSVDFVTVKDIGAPSIEKIDFETLKGLMA